MGGLIGFQMKGMTVVVFIIIISASGEWVAAQPQVHHVVGGDRGWDPTSDLLSWSSGSEIISNQQYVEQHTKWSKPVPGTVKCNIDASFSKEQNQVGVDLCLRDEFGLLMGAKTMWFQPLVDVKFGEAYGLKAAILWTRELGLKDVVFELDAKLVVDAMRNPTTDVT